MADHDLDRNESATPHKLSEARRRGQVAKSAEVVSACVFAAAVASDADANPSANSRR